MKTKEDEILKIHLAPGGEVWYSDGVENPRASSGGLSGFVSGLATHGSSKYRVLGMPEHAPLIMELYQHYCSHRREGVLEVASPLVCENERERHDPEIALFRMRQCLAPPSLGGWHRFTELDYPSYAISAQLAKDNGFNDHIRRLLLTHPAWYDLTFIDTIRPEYVVHLLSYILDPRWFVDFRRPERITKIKTFLGLTPRVMRAVSRGEAKDRRAVRCRTALYCWKGDEQPSSADMERPGNFLWRRWRHAGGGAKGDLRATQAFVSYFIRTWQQQLVQLQHQQLDMFLPSSLLKGHEVEAYRAPRACSHRDTLTRDGFMQEVTIRLRFNRECLGYAKGTTRKNKVIYRMPRDSQHRVMFLPSWWRSRFRYAAKVVGRCGDLVKQINWDPIVDGNLSEWRRTITPAHQDRKRRARYALHEAFRPGDMIGINAVLPAKMSLDDFTELLTVVDDHVSSPERVPRPTISTSLPAASSSADNV